MKITITVNIEGKKRRLSIVPELVGDKFIVPPYCYDQSGNKYSTENWKHKFESVLP